MESEKFNKPGLVLFSLAFFAALVFFVFVIIHNPGPIDSKWTAVVATGISHDDIMKRENEWRKSTPASIALGQQLYSVNCSGCHIAQSHAPGQDFVLAAVKAKQIPTGLKETDLDRIIFRGIPTWGERVKQTMPRQDAISSPNRWAIVHYLRSLVPDAPLASSSDWKSFDDEIIW